MLENGSPKAQFSATTKAQSAKVFAGEEVKNITQHVFLGCEEVHVVIVQSVRFEPANKRRVVNHLLYSINIRTMLLMSN